MKALALAAVSMMLGTATADEIAPPPKATMVMTRDLEGIAGKACRRRIGMTRRSSSTCSKAR